MKSLRLVGLFGLTLGVQLSVSAGIGSLLFGTNELQTITVTDMTEAGRKAPSATHQHPLYYSAISGGYHDFGGIIAGDRMIARAAVNKLMIDVLAKEDYLPAKADQKPDLIVVWMWGTMYTIMESYPNSGVGLRRQVNEAQLLHFLGGEKLGVYDATHAMFPETTLSPQLFFAGGDRQRLLETARDDLYVAVVAAYDPRLDAHGHATLLWTTRISSPSHGYWLPDALPAMVAMAAPFIGHETDRPMWVKATDKFKPDVQIGDVKMVEYLKDSEQKVVEAGSNK